MNNENNPYQYDPERQSGSSYNHQDYHSHNENPYDTRDDYSNYGGSPPPPKKRGGGVALGVIVCRIGGGIDFFHCGVLLFLYKGYDKLVETPPKVVETLPPDRRILSSLCRVMSRRRLRMSSIRVSIWKISRVPPRKRARSFCLFQKSWRRQSRPSSRSTRTS